MSKDFQPIMEDGVIAGNVYNKYEARNPIARWLMQGFLRAVEDLVRQSGAMDIHEIGCGEGHLSVRLAAVSGGRMRASDFSVQVIDLARKLHADAGIAFKAAAIEDLSPSEDAAELIVCCEVLEHLPDPEASLDKLRSLARPYCLLSVPREPIWRILNMARGRYWRDLGNTPGHLQHWSRSSFLRLVRRYFDVVAERQPLPWTVVLCRSR